MKKLLNNKGSALFMVFSVMSVLIIAATGVFCAVSTNRKNTDNHYEGEQAYQTAYSVSTAVSDYIDSYLMGIMGKEASSVSNSLVSQMLSMPKFDPLHPDKADAIIKTGQENSDGSVANFTNLQGMGMGEYAVEIKKTNLKTEGAGQDENITHTFEIKTTADVNGEKVTITEYKTIVTGPTSYFTRMFTSTGGSAQDVTLSAQRVYTPNYLENDYSILSGQIYNDIIASGTLEIVNNNTLFEERECNIFVAENFYFKGSQNPLCAKGGNIYVGRDFECINSGTSIGIDTTKIYVIGNMTLKNLQSIGAKNIYINGNLTIENVSNLSNMNFYVNGNLTYSGSSNCDNSNFMVNGSSNVTKIGNTNIQLKTSDPWISDDVKEIAQKISTETARQNYATWDAEAKCKNAPRVVKAASNTCVTIDDENAIIESSEAGYSNIYIKATTHDLYIYLKPDASGNFSFTGECGKVMVEGKYSVIFVLPSNANFVQHAQCYVGHIGWLCRYKNKSVNQLIADYQSQQINTDNTTSFFVNYVDKTTGIIKEDFVKADGTEGNDYYLHNNIFLITKGKEKIIDLSGGMSTFMGSIYCRDSVLKMGNGNSKFAIGGGVIAGTYEFGGATDAFVFIKPYDYYGTHEGNPDSLIKVLMTSSLNVTGNAIIDAGTIGYK